MRVFTSVRLFATAMLAVVGAFAGCGGAGEGSNPTNPDSPAGVTYTVSPNTLLLAPGQSGTVLVTVTRSPDFEGELGLAVSGLAPDVTATFSPSSLSHGTTSSTLTITAGTGGSAFGTLSLGIEPSLGGKRVNINGTPPAFSITVSIRPTIVVNKAGSGSGTIASAPAGINCGTVCSATFLFVPITLTATPAAGSALTGWSRAECAGSSLTCTFTPRANSMSNFNFVTATFTSTAQAATIDASPSQLLLHADVRRPLALR
jgi:hypothetical protein